MSARRRKGKTLVKARSILKEIFDKSYLEEGKLRPTIHGAIMALAYALGEKELEDIITDKTDELMELVKCQ